MLASFLKILHGEPPDRIVWTADITYWIAGQKEGGLASPSWETESGYLQLHDQLGILPYYYYEKFWVASPQYSPEIRVSQEMDGRGYTNRIQTPQGELTETNLWLPASCSFGCTRHYVESESDLDVLLYLLERRMLVVDNLADYPERMQKWRASGGLPSLGLPRSPLSSFVYEWAGLQVASYLLADCREKVQAALDLMEAQEAPILDALCRLRPALVHFPDNLSSDNLAGYYDRYMAGPHVRRLERLHAAGIKVAVHLDGTVRGLLPRLVRSGFDAIEALTPAPGGDLTPAEIAVLAGDGPVILWGGVPGILFSPPFTWADMEKYVHGLLSAWEGRRFVLGVADQVPPNGDITFCRRIADLITNLK
jgi:hypothetical protein